MLPLGLIQVPRPFCCRTDFVHDVGHGARGILLPHPG